MNDFTKEELQDIHNSLYNDPSMQRISAELLDKIQSMIDNYCAHDQVYEQDSCRVDICKKCKEIF